jgi:hypothetical protein
MGIVLQLGQKFNDSEINALHRWTLGLIPALSKGDRRKQLLSRRTLDFPLDAIYSLFALLQTLKWITSTLLHCVAYILQP